MTRVHAAAQGSAMQSPAPRSLDRAERLQWLRLIRSENVGPITFRRT
ncbi:MAG: hypothetical protein IID48_10390 [Proteobacteria bacterium]|nr:hypothetical protein [Pseudomonadota bacterium]